MRPTRIVLIIFFFGFFTRDFSQNNVCANAEPFCTGQTMNFPATTNVTTSQGGPFYDCLFSQPNPAWFFMQIATTGTMSISMAAQWDIDFICWGPFSSLSGACNSLTASNVEDCSYSGAPTETCVISNAIAGQFYIMLITNYSNQTQNITFTQNNANNTGAASTNCGIVCMVAAGNSGLICSGQNVTLLLGTSTSTAVTSYTWFGPSSYSSTAQSPLLTNVQAGGTYTIRAASSSTVNNVPYTGTCQAVTTVSILQYPTFSVTPSSTSICQGGYFYGGVTFSSGVNPSGFTCTWTPSGAGGTLTLIQPPLLPTSNTLATMVYSVSVAPTNTAVSCAVTKTMTVTIHNPLTPTITLPPPLCDTFAPLQLTATPGGGTWSANPAVSSGGLFVPAAATITPSWVTYAVSSGSCVVSSTQSVSVSKFYSAALTASVATRCVQDPPLNLMNIVAQTSGTWSGTQVTNNLFSAANLPTGSYSFTYNTFSLPNTSVCPASTVLLISVFNPPAPVINAINPVCNTAGTVILTASPFNGVWSGNSGISVLGLQTPSLNLIGTNNVIYTAGQGTCVASTSKTFQVSQFNTAALTLSVPNLCVNSPTFNLMGIVQNTNGLWSGVNTTNNSFNPAGLPTNTYNLTYQTFSFPNTTLCPDFRNIAVSVLNPQVPSITPVGPYCNIQSPVQLTVSPATGTWIPSSFLSPSGVFTPSLSSIGNNAVQYVTGTSTCSAQQTKVIQTEAFVSAAITNSISDLCNTSAAVNLSPFALNSLGIWSGPGVLGSLFSPATMGSGNFVLMYNTSSSPSGLCPDKSTLAVQVFSLAIPSIIKSGPFCTNSKPTQLQVSPVGGFFTSGINAIVSLAGVFNPAQAVIGSNVITYSIAAGPCIANAQAIIQVEKFVSADFDKMTEPAYCKNSAPFNLNSLVHNPGGFWSGDGVSGNMFNPSLANVGDNNVVTYHTNSSPSTLLCPDSKVIRIKVKNQPTVEISANIVKGCAPLSVDFSMITTDAGVGLWTLSDGTTYEGALANHVFSSAGSYSVQFNYADTEAKGCATQVILKNPIEVYEMPRANFSFSPDEVSVSNPEVKLNNTSTVFENNQYVWIVEGQNQRFELHPLLYFPAIGNYKVTLTATNVHACKSEMSKIIEVKNDFNIFIPNSFTPNDDGINDVFMPVFSPFGLDPATYDLEIFDRWGHSMYHTKDFTNGWDGSANDQPEVEVKQDSYIYKIRYKDLEGRVYNRTGSVTLLKN